MKVLETLENRVNKLIAFSIELSQKNQQYEQSIEMLHLEIDELKFENAKLAEDNTQLIAQIKAMENAFEKENQNMLNLHEEKSLAKLVVDDLIKSIDALIERENQQ